MALYAAISDIEQLRDHLAIAKLLEWNPGALTGAQLDRNELSVFVNRENIKDVCLFLRDHASLNFFCDLTCVDWYPSEPRFHVKYHLLSHSRKERLRLTVKLLGDDASIESITSVWPAANFFERELFDLFGIRFLGHPNLRRIMMPEDWEGHPLRKDYPVEGYR